MLPLLLFGSAVRDTWFCHARADPLSVTGIDTDLLMTLIY
jgi:hypothetical protein